MAKLEPILIEILFNNGGIILEDFFIKEMSEKLDLKKEVISKRINILISNKKLYRFEKKIYFFN